MIIVDRALEARQREGRPVRVGMVGAGFMGSGIAAVAAQQDTLVRLKDTDLLRVARGLKAARDVFEERRRKRRITKARFDDLVTLVGGTTEYSGFANVDLAIEAVFRSWNVRSWIVCTRARSSSSFHL